MKLNERVAIVTGAGQNIGEAVAWRLAKEGATVVVADINAENANKVASEINEAGHKAVSECVNVAVKKTLIKWLAIY